MKTLLLAILLIASTGHAQTVKVKKETARINGGNAEGFEVDLPGTADDVENQLNKYLKPLGKSKRSDDAVTIAQPVISGKNYTSPLYATVKQKGNGVAAWIGIKSGEWSSDTDEIKKTIEKMAHEFGVTFHRELIQRQIDESTRASLVTERQQQRLVNQNKDLTLKIEDNKREKIQLEKSLENNKLELETLIKKLEQNKKDQDSVAVAGEQIKKLQEMQKEKQRKVH